MQICREVRQRYVKRHMYMYICEAAKTIERMRKDGKWWSDEGIFGDENVSNGVCCTTADRAGIGETNLTDAGMLCNGLVSGGCARCLGPCVRHLEQSA